MKKLILITTLLLLLAVVAIGCKADDATKETALTLGERAGTYSGKSSTGLETILLIIKPTGSLEYSQMPNNDPPNYQASGSVDPSSTALSFTFNVANGINKPVTCTFNSTTTTDTAILTIPLILGGGSITVTKQEE